MPAQDCLTPLQRRALLKRVFREKVSVSQACREFGVSRPTYYKWKRRIDGIGKDVKYAEKLSALSDQRPSGQSHWNAIDPAIVRKVLDLIVSNPSLSSHKLAERIARVGNHGVQNILERENLSRYELRLAYSKAQKAAPAPVFARFIDRVRYVLEQFIPTLAPAPPPERRQFFFRALKIFSVSVLTSFLFGFGVLSWIRKISQATSASSAIGLVFATTALLMGSFFFLYSFKYYITLALVLSFSQSEGVNNVEQRTKGRGKGFLSWILGLANGNGSASPEDVRGKAVGLTPNLEHVRLKRKPYVSIHIPFYNEKNVVERSIVAATNFDYPEYEVILCDDSTDETVDIIRNYQKKHLAKGERLKTIKNKKEGWELTEIEVRPGVTLKHLHRTSRSGFKGGALKLALTLVDPRTEFISVFDADFVPYPDTLELFLKYFQATTGTLDFKNNKQLKQQRSNIAAVQGYQWHVLNKSENWITKGVRSEYAGSYVIERSGREIYGALKQISGAVYMIRRDVLEEVGWETSITEDFQLTLKLYEKGYKVVYTPYVQAPAECVSTLKRLIRQRMRWAEGHSNNIRKMFWRLLLNPKLTLNEKLEFLYLSPYYLQAFFFLIGTFSWLISETLFPARLPFWTQLWGWSLVLTNMLSLPLMNAVGLFLEESEEKDYAGLASFIALSYIVVPFQAYASLKGFLKGEGPWFRTPKTGRITDVLKRGTFYKFISGILPGRAAQAPIAADLSRLAPIPASINQSSASWRISVNPYVALATASNISTRLSAFSTFNSFNLKPKRMRWLGRVIMVFVLTASLLVHSMAFNVQPVEANWWATSWQYRKKLTVSAASGNGVSSGYSVKFTATGADAADIYNDSLSTGNDFRIVYWNGSSWVELDRDLVTFSSTEIEVWFKLQAAISGGSSDDNYYAYYKNSGAGSPPANKGNIYKVWDDFNDNSLDAAWTAYGSTWSETNQQIEFNGGDGGQLYRAGAADVAVSAKFVFIYYPCTYWDIVARHSDTSNYIYIQWAAGCPEWSIPSVWMIYKVVGGAHTKLEPNISLGGPVEGDIVELRVAGNTIKLLKNGAELATRTDTSLPSGSGVGFRKGGYDQTGVEFKADDFKTRLFVATEPTVSAGSEEEVPEMVALLLPVVLLVPLIVKHCRKKKEGLAFAKAY